MDVAVFVVANLMQCTVKLIIYLFLLFTFMSKHLPNSVAYKLWFDVLCTHVFQHVKRMLLQ